MTEPEQPAQQPAPAAAPHVLTPEELAARTLALHERQGPALRALKPRRPA